MNKVSALVITKNEAEVIEGCLKSLSFADEIVVVDSGSTDKTLEIAKKYQAKIFHHDFDGFANQRNFAISKAKNNWVILVDADERISKSLSLEIPDAINSNDFTNYAIKYRAFLLGREFKFGGFGYGVETHIRLFDKRQCRYSTVKKVHEMMEINGQTGQLTGPIIHFTHRNISHILQKLDRDTTEEARVLFQNREKKVNSLKLIEVPLRFFYYRYLKQKGYRGGIEGLIEAVNAAYYYFIVYAKLWELQRGSLSIAEMESKIEDLPWK